MSPYVGEKTVIVHASKGFEEGTMRRMTEVILGIFPLLIIRKVAVLSGPSHAEEVVRKCPTTVVVAAFKRETAEFVQQPFINSYFRVYTHPDVIGVEVGGALKNIIAIGSGLSDGLGFGDNAKAALLTRGLAEITRLGTAMGADPPTFSGLSGVGDLVVTCTSRHSRNLESWLYVGRGQIDARSAGDDGNGCRRCKNDPVCLSASSSLRGGNADYNAAVRSAFS